MTEIYDLLAHHKADALNIAGTGTNAAERFVECKPIALMSGTQLLEMVLAVQLINKLVRAARAISVELSVAQRSIAALAALWWSLCESALGDRNNRRTRGGRALEPVLRSQGVKDKADLIVLTALGISNY